MKTRALVNSVVMVLLIGVLATSAGWAQDDGYERLVTQSEFATGVVAAILGQDRTKIDDAEAMTVLKDKGLVPDEWTGDGHVTMGEAGGTFHHLGFQIYIEESDDLLSVGVFEQILRHHMGDFKKTRHHWDIVHHFSMGLELGEYRQRLLGPTAGNAYGQGIVSPSDF